MTEVKLPTEEVRLPVSRYVCGRKGMEISPSGHYVLACVYDAQSLALDEARKEIERLKAGERELIEEFVKFLYGWKLLTPEYAIDRFLATRMEGGKG